MAKPTKEVLIRMLVKDLIRREPDMAAHEADARYRVSHWGGAGPCTLRDLALKARNADLISEQDYLAAAPEIHYGNREWNKIEKRRENSRHRAAQKVIMTDAEGRPLDKPRRADFDSDIAFIHATHTFNDELTGIGNRAFDEGFKAAMARPSMPPGTRKG
jgi:hypothetical protein